MGWLRRLRATFGGSSVDRTLDDEICFHIEQRTQEYVRTGMTQADAEREARRRFGSVSLAREEARDTDTVRWLGDVGQDVRYGLRQMRDNKRWAAIVLLSLSLGIGANSALFSVIDAALLRPLPVGEPDELVFFDWTSGPRRMLASMSGSTFRDPATGAMSSTSFSYQAFERFRAETTTLSDVMVFAPLDLNVNIDGRPALATGQLVSGNYYRGLRVPAVLGRTIQNADDAPAAPPVTVITHRYWQRQFASDPTVLGKTMSANGVPITIVGVSAPEFQGSNGFGTSADFSLPIALEPRFRRPGSNGTEPWRWWVLMMGRLKPGVGREQVQAELGPVFQTSAIDGWNAAPPQVRSSPSAQGPRDLPHLRVFPGSRGLTDFVRVTVRPLYVLMAIFWLLLAIACINVANLLLARSASRQREIGVRLAIGASRGVRWIYGPSGRSA